MKPHMSYLALLRHKDAVRTMLGGFLSRFYGATMCLGPITMLTVVGYSYFIAATVTSCTAFCAFFIAPRISKAMDRRGQRAVIPWATLASMVGLTGLLVNTWLAGPVWADYPFAMLMGMAPSVQAITRSRWTHLLMLEGGDYEQVRTAYSLEGVLDDVAFMVGPAVVIAMSSLWFPEAGPLFAGLTFTAGMTIVLSCRRTEPEPISAEALAQKKAAGERSVLREYPMMRILFASTFLMGVFFGALDPTTLALCTAASSAAIASVVFACSSIASIVAGFVFGAIRISARMSRQLIVAGCVLGVLYGFMAIVNDVPSLIAVSTVAAFAYAPFIITANSACQRCVSPDRITEALTWVGTGMVLGLAFGPLASGYLISSVSVHAGLVMCACCALLIPVLLLANMRRLRESLDHEKVPVDASAVKD